jgi:transposase
MYLARPCESDSHITQVFERVQDFATMLRERRGAGLDAWLAQIEEQKVLELKNLVGGLHKDYGAVKAGLTLKWGNGPVKGNVLRLKLLKRPSYGRSGFQTLRKRVLKRA